jgi:mono/diheme cytochrome c family protein
VPRHPTFLVVAGCAVFAASLFAQGVTPAPQPSAPAAAASTADRNAPRQMFQRYCASCHNSKLKTAGLALDALDLNAIHAHPQAWEKVVTKLRTGAMPPVGLPRPDAATYDTVATWLEDQLDAIAAASPNPGVRPPLHRLNRTEYKNAIRDLLALEDLPRELDIDVLLPADDASYGFDNIADALGTSPSLLERYLVAAQKISRVAIGDRSMPMIVDTYRVPSQLPQEDRLEGHPFGTRGGIRIERHFPLDGEYVFRVALGGGRSQDRHDLELLIDGERAHVFAIDGRGRGRGRGGAPGPAPAPGTPGAVTPGALAAAGMDQSGSNIEVRRTVTAGHHVVLATFVKKSSAIVEDTLRPFSRTGQANAPAQPALASLTITGPVTIAGPGDTSSRRRIFSCHPARGAQESACAREILTSVARRAYRRPVTDADLQTLMPFYEAGRGDGGFEAGIQRALERVLVSPSFLFRVERDPAAAAGRSQPSTAPADAARPRAARISDVELASRLSFFLWSSIPDDQLLEAAARGALAKPAELERQVKRMMADPRARALVDNFAGQWLFLRNIDGVAPDPRVFPDFDEALRRAMRRETELFVHDALSNDRSVMELLTADYTFVNERLAKHYGIPHIYGDQFRKVSLADTPRRGLLGHGSVLTVTSYAHRTSPVLRGKWMLDNVLGSPPPPPPPDIPALPETNAKTGKPLTMREAMAQHRNNPACSGCHARMDPLGFALENYDAVGRWRSRLADAPIDASGALPDGTTFEGSRGLVDAILRNRGAFATTLIERLMTYALGRGVEYFDAPAVRAVRDEAAAQNFRFSAIIVGIAKSVPFQMRGASSAAAPSRAEIDATAGDVRRPASGRGDH